MPSILLEYNVSGYLANIRKFHSYRLLVFDTYDIAEVMGMVHNKLKIPAGHPIEMMVKCADGGYVACRLAELLGEVFSSLENGNPLHFPEWKAEHPATLKVVVHTGRKAAAKRAMKNQVSCAAGNLAFISHNFGV